MDKVLHELTILGFITSYDDGKTYTLSDAARRTPIMASIEIVIEAEQRERLGIESPDESARSAMAISNSPSSAAGPVVHSTGPFL
jgi:hypothetical protein